MQKFDGMSVLKCFLFHSISTPSNFSQVTDADLQPGMLRVLEVDKRLTLPTRTHIRKKKQKWTWSKYSKKQSYSVLFQFSSPGLLVTGADVLHAWTIPSFSIKNDAIPGRISRKKKIVFLWDESEKSKRTRYPSRKRTRYHSKIKFINQIPSLHRYLPLHPTRRCLLRPVFRTLRSSLDEDVGMYICKENQIHTPISVSPQVPTSSSNAKVSSTASVPNFVALFTPTCRLW